MSESDDERDNDENDHVDRAMSDSDIRDLLRKRPITLEQSFASGERLQLLCPPETDAGTFERMKIAFGPFSASVLSGFVRVTAPARRDEVQDLWQVIMRDAMPQDEQRAPGGEPLQTIRTATLGWRLLALLGAAIELLATASSAVGSWRASGQPTGLECRLGSGLLTFETLGAIGTADQLGQLADPTYVAPLMGYPSNAVLGRFLDVEEIVPIRARCDRSAVLIAEVFAVAASVVADPFWRTFMKWKHGAIGTSPGVSPLWLQDARGLDDGAIEDRLNSGIVVFDAQRHPRVYVWPAQRVDFVAYSHLAMQALTVAQLIVESVLRYAEPDNAWPIAIYEIDEQFGPDAPERAALDRLARSGYPMAALAGMWREGLT